MDLLGRIDWGSFSVNGTNMAFQKSAVCFRSGSPSLGRQYRLIDRSLGLAQDWPFSLAPLDCYSIRDFHDHGHFLGPLDVEID